MLVEKNWKTKCRHRVLEVAALSDPFEICELFQEFGTKKYIYKIRHSKLGIVLKFGMSCPETDNTEPGERLYRQIGHAASWGRKKIQGPNGSEWNNIETTYRQLFKRKLNRQDLIVDVWDLTNYEFRTINPKLEIIAIENSLIEEYESITGRRPIGNIKDESTVKYRSAIPVGLIDSLTES